MRAVLFLLSMLLAHDVAASVRCENVKLKAHAPKSVPCAYAVVALEYGVPVKVFYAIALAETRAALGRKLKQPWPWTLNVEGVGYRYGSRRAAYAALQGLILRGTVAVDVGLMQVHWRWHAAKLEHTWVGLDPYHNLRVGASVLRDCYRRLHNWTLASGCYHSSTPWRASQYADNVSSIMAQVR
jgi:hypothetical protein